MYLADFLNFHRFQFRLFIKKFLLSRQSFTEHIPNALLVDQQISRQKMEFTQADNSFSVAGSLDPMEIKQEPVDHSISGSSYPKADPLLMQFEAKHSGSKS